MKRILVLIVLLAAVVAGGWYLASHRAQPPTIRSMAVSQKDQPSSTPAATAPAPTPIQPAAESPSGPLSQTNPYAADPLFASPGSVPPSLPPETVLQNMRTAIRQYGSAFAGNPVGTNEEITRALNGENPKQIKFLRADTGLRMNQQGELIDSWGTPFFFHQLSGTEMEIRSAGPDRKMWTSDDLVTR